MRILLSAYACRPNAGSEPGFGWNWATHLAARGFDVHVLVAKRNQEPIEAGLRANSIANLCFTYISVPWEWAKISEALHYVVWQFAALKAARELALKVDFDLIHHVTYGSVHVPSQLWRLGIPVVFGPVGGGQTAPASMLKYFGGGKYTERLRSSATKLLKSSPVHRQWLRRMNVILAANNETLNLVRTLGCKNSRVMCDTAIPVDCFADAPRSYEKSGEALRLLWVGRMLARKALPLALDALKEVHENVTLTIAGDGLAPQIVHNMIRDRNLQQRVTWKGSRLTFEELQTAYAEHDALLFSSLRDSFGSQLLEAMAMGLPIITLDLHGAHDFLPDSASLKVPVGSPDETVRSLASAITQLASLSVAKRDQMSMHAWNFAKTLSWPARLEVIEKLYAEVLSRATSLETASASKAAVEVV